MIRFFLLEIIAILLYIISVSLDSLINIPLLTSSFYSLYLLALMFLIIIVFPAGILLAFTERYAPQAMPSNAWKTLTPAKKDQKISLLFVVLSIVFGWGSFFLLILMNFSVIFSLLFAQFILTLIFILFLIKYPPEKRGSPDLKPKFIAFFLSLVTMVTMLALLEILVYLL